MPKSANQKRKLLVLAKVFSEHTDEDHGLTLKEITALLEGYQIKAERKTVYQDLEDLRAFGMDIVSERKNRTVNYRLASRDFELPELKLLVDSVQFAKFITEKKSRELIKKLESLVSTHQARELHRQVILSGRVKTGNESVYYSVDQIHAAIGSDVQIRFQYWQWNAKKEPELRHGGAWYQISPWALNWDDEYYYLIGYDAENGQIRHYRVDKMLHLEATQEKRQGREAFEKLDPARYAKALFGMFGAEEQEVTLLCKSGMAGIIIDRFGREVNMVPAGEGFFRVHVRVAASRQFLAWVIGLGEGVKITAPQELVGRMREEARRLTREYAEEKE